MRPACGRRLRRDLIRCVPDRALSALPSPLARVLAFASILVAGLAGALIGAGFVGLQCTGACGTPKAVGALIGAVLAAAGTAIVAILVLRAMGEWRALHNNPNPPSGTQG